MNKRQFGQYFTKKNLWLKKQIKNFIQESNCKIAYDPFAGDGDLLRVSNEYGIKKVEGLDIDPNLSWKINDSLEKIPHIDNAIIITNPPYLTKYSAKRKKMDKTIFKYFKHHTDLYQLAIDKILEVQDFAVIIVPETYINSSFFKRHLARVHTITILTENPFNDTENPVCVVCFDNIYKNPPMINVYIDEVFINNYSYFESLKLTPKKNVKIRFNDKNGKMALRAVDMPDPRKKIEFLKVDELKYDIKRIKESSRLVTIIELDCKGIELKKLISECNRILNEYRKKTKDITLSPFKGNNKNGERRRRLDYKTARSLIEIAIYNLKGDKVNA